MFQSSYNVNERSLYNKIILIISLIIFTGNFFTFLGGPLNLFNLSTLRNLYDDFNFYKLLDFVRINYSIFTLIINLFFLTFFLKLKSFKKNKLFLILCLLIFFPQLIGFVNNLIIDKKIDIQSLTTLVQIFSIIINLLIIFNLSSKKDLKLIYFIILFALSFQFLIFFSNYSILEVQYGGFPLEINIGEFNKKLYFNSNGLGRTAVVFYIIFLIIFFETKNIYLKYSSLLLISIFQFFIIQLSGRFNLLGLLIIYICVFFLYKKIIIKNWKEFFMFIFLIIFLSENYTIYKTQLLKEKIKNNSASKLDLLNYEFNNNLFRNSDGINKIDKITLNNEVQMIINNNSLIIKLNNISTGRISKWLNILLTHDKQILGIGPNKDRLYFRDNKNYRGADDAASGILYQYISSGIIGVICLILFYYRLFKIIKNFKPNNKDRNIYYKSLLIFIYLSFRICFENGFLIFGIDLLLMLASIGIIISCHEKNYLKFSIK